jgi:tRNA-dihydrouridine synthase
MKMRLGYENAKEILNTIPILDNHPLKNIAIHARLGKQLYKGGVDLEGFQKALDKTKHLLYYNGDITSVEAFNKVRERFPSITHFMIGRGLIADPFLPSMIKNNTSEYPKNHLETFSKFHDTIYHEYKDYLSGDKHALLKMNSFWEYFAQTFDNPQKTFKRIKKSKSITAYEDAVRDILK